MVVGSTVSTIFRISASFAHAAGTDATGRTVRLSSAPRPYPVDLPAARTAGRQPSQRELADYAGLEALYVSKLARAAERAGLVTRAEHPADPRAVQLTLTDDGSQLIGRAVAVIRELNEELAAPLGDSRRRALGHTLQILLGQSGQEDRRQEMTSTSPFTGRDINLAARATRDVLNGLLADAGIDFNQWVALRTIALAGPTEAGALRDDLADDLRVHPTAADDLLAGLDRAGFTGRRDGQIALTPDGQALYQRLQSAVGQATAELYAGIDPDDLAAAGRVLRQVTERATRLGN